MHLKNDVNDYHISTLVPFGEDRWETCVFDDSLTRRTDRSKVVSICQTKDQAYAAHYAVVNAIRFLEGIGYE
jgi:hypothetical protein